MKFSSEINVDGVSNEKPIGFLDLEKKRTCIKIITDRGSRGVEVCRRKDQRKSNKDVKKRGGNLWKRSENRIFEKRSQLGVLRRSQEISDALAFEL